MFKKVLVFSLAMLMIAGATVIAGEIDLEGIKCVMSGKDVSPEISAEYKDAKVYFCCSGCASGFTKNSEKYAVKANHQLVATKQYEQTSCPFSGRELDPNIFVTLAGTKVGFCCDGCKGKVESGKDDATKLELAFADKTFAKAFKKVKPEEDQRSSAAGRN